MRLVTYRNLSCGLHINPIISDKKILMFSHQDYLCRHLLIFPGSCPPSIFSASELNFCVRNGNRWTLTAINTDCIVRRFFKRQMGLYYNKSDLSSVFLKNFKTFFGAVKTTTSALSVLIFFGYYILPRLRLAITK